MVPMKGSEGASLPCPDDKSEEGGERKERITDINVQQYMWIHEMTLNPDYDRGEGAGGGGDSEEWGSVGYA